MKGYQALLANMKTGDSERDRFTVKLERATKQHAAWDERYQVLVEMVASIEAGIKDVCAGKDRISISPSRYGTNSQ
jgi:hypothetical protein